MSDTTYALQHLRVFGRSSAVALPLQCAVLVPNLKAHVVHGVYSGQELSSAFCCGREAASDFIVSSVS